MLKQTLARLSPEDGPNLVRSVRLLLTIGAARVTLFLAFLLLLRRMGPAQFGIFFVGYNTLAFVPLIVDLGIGQTFVRHISFYRNTRPAFSAYLHWLFFVLKLASVGGLLLVALFALPVIAKFLNMQNQQWLLMAAIMGSGAVVLSDYANCVFQSQCLFKRYELYLFLRNTLFLTAVVLLVVLNRTLLTPTALILALVAINLTLAGSAYPYVSRRWQQRTGEFANFRSSLIRYSKWLTVAAICFALYRRMDVYLLSHFRTVHEVGIYSVAVVLVEPVAMISPALVTVFLPGISNEPTPHKLRSYARLVGMICSLVFIGICLYLGVLRLVFPLLVAEYREAFPVVAVLLVGTVFLIGYNMLSLIFLASDRPELFGQIAFVMAAFSLIANWFAVPAYGVLGAAGVYGACQALGILLAAFSIRRLLREGKPVLHLESEPFVPTESILT